MAYFSANSVGANNLEEIGLFGIFFLDTLDNNNLIASLDQIVSLGMLDGILNKSFVSYNVMVFRLGEYSHTFFRLDKC